MQRIDLGRYHVLIGTGLLDRLNALVAETPVRSAATIAIVSDSNVAPLYAERTRAALGSGGAAPRTELLVVPAGEASKSRREWALLTDAMFARGLGRDTAVVALGGGVIGDLAGFAAATYTRGVPVVQVPTSLLAMVDSSIGGKTGVDTPAGKNLVGAFHWPALVVIDPSLLVTLPLEHWRAGFAEILKHGAIASEPHFRRAAAMAAALPNADAGALQTLIADSIGIKAEFVARDERECGPRRALNAGHTLAHALEQVSRFAISHGEAVAIGLVLETALGERLGVTAPGTADELRAALTRAGLPVDVPSSLETADILAATRSDKKTRDGHVEYALLAGLGKIDDAQGRFSRAVADDDVGYILQTFREPTVAPNA
ncbi:MAG: 3-dehydroquinate synthase [Gemmatimonadaceae bacterium]